MSPKPKLLTINCSMRKHRVCDSSIDEVVSHLPKSFGVERYYINDLNINGCLVGCSKYCIDNPYQCSQPDDFSSFFEKIKNSAGLIIAAPQYFRAPPAKAQAFFERMISLCFWQESSKTNAPSPLLDKPCALIGVAEYNDPTFILEYLRSFCQVCKMRAITIMNFPYHGLAVQGVSNNLEDNAVFFPRKRAKELAEALVSSI